MCSWIVLLLERLEGVCLGGGLSFSGTKVFFLKPSHIHVFLFDFRRQAVLVAPGKIRVSDISSEVVEDLDFSGTRVIEMSLGFGHLVAATHNQVSAGLRVRW